MEFSISVKDDGYARVFIDAYDDDKVWLSVFGRRGSMAVVLNKDEAKQVLEAFQQLVGEKEAA
jgi:hypothetical protein